VGRVSRMSSEFGRGMNHAAFSLRGKYMSTSSHLDSPGSGSAPGLRLSLTKGVSLPCSVVTTPLRAPEQQQARCPPVPFLEGQFHGYFFARFLAVPPFLEVKCPVVGIYGSTRPWDKGSLASENVRTNSNLSRKIWSCPLFPRSARKCGRVIPWEWGSATRAIPLVHEQRDKDQRCRAPIGGTDGVRAISESGQIARMPRRPTV